jgi:4-amino-4-deoxy-L-arabinose transferase-like glycosyltransferase
VELRAVEFVRLASQVSVQRADEATRRILLLVGILILIRAFMSALLPLSFDEAYYWRWSQNLAAGYFDHPPLIAYVIRAGTIIFGDTEFGVRFISWLLSIAASWALWRGAALILKSGYVGAVTALVYNMTLMAGVEALVATPDAPSVAAAAFFFYALAKVAATSDGRWWLAAGVAGGFALLSKYTGFFLGAGAVVWLALVPNERHWFRSVWPYAGAAIGIVMFVPVVFWNAAHDWISFAFQFGRAGSGAFEARFLGEFLAGQILLATPFVFVLGIAGAAGILFSNLRTKTDLGLAPLLLMPAVLYFLIHSLHGRVQGNWTCFLYPMFAVCAVEAMRWELPDWRGRILAITKTAALPTALIFTLVAYAHALSPIISLEGTRDPVARLLAVGFAPMAREIEARRLELGAPTILTTNYVETGWLSFYLPSNAWVVQVNERYRWLAEPAPPPEIFDGQMLYITLDRRDMSEMLAERFATVERLGEVERRSGESVLEDYILYRVSGPIGSVLD